MCIKNTRMFLKRKRFLLVITMKPWSLERRKTIAIDIAVETGSDKSMDECERYDIEILLKNSSLLFSRLLYQIPNLFRIYFSYIEILRNYFIVI